jgi:hypothetical protein
VELIDPLRLFVTAHSHESLLGKRVGGKGNFILPSHLSTSSAQQDTNATSMPYLGSALPNSQLPCESQNATRHRQMLSISSSGSQPAEVTSETAMETKDLRASQLLNSY